MDPGTTKADKASADKKKEALNPSDHSDSMPATSSAAPGVTGLDRGVTDSVTYEAKQHFHVRPTKLGEFRKTVDPFSEMTGRIYGLQKLGQSEYGGFGQSEYGGFGQSEYGGIGPAHATGVASVPTRPKPLIVSNPPSVLPGMPEMSEDAQGGTGIPRQQSVASSVSDGNLMDLQKTETSPGSEDSAVDAGKVAHGGGIAKENNNVWPPPPPLS